MFIPAQRGICIRITVYLESWKVYPEMARNPYTNTAHPRDYEIYLEGGKGSVY